MARVRGRSRRRRSDFTLTANSELVSRPFSEWSTVPNPYPVKNSLRLLLALALAATASAAGIDGKWHAEFESQIGQQKYTFELKADGEKLTGKAIADRPVVGKTEIELKNGKIVKDEVSFTENLKFQDQEIAIEYKGKLVGDELKLHRKVGDIAEYDIVAKRVSEKAEKK